MCLVLECVITGSCYGRYKNCLSLKVLAMKLYNVITNWDVSVSVCTRARMCVITGSCHGGYKICLLLKVLAITNFSLCRVSNESSFTFREVELGMYRARRSAQPPVPRTATEFVMWMSDTLAENYNQHFKGAVELGTERAIIFMSSVIIPRLAEVQHAFYDGTFFCVPVLFYQLFSILAVFRDKALPVASVLMTGKSEALYRKVTAKILELAPDLAPDTFMGDFERASRNALESSFPNARFIGCQFHYSQALWRKCQKLGLTDVYKNNMEFKSFLKKLMSVPYLPANQIRGIALTLFDQPINVNNHIRTNIRKFRQYFFRFWLNTVTPEKFSVYDVPYGTNNFSESFHARLKARIRVHHPSMWSFVGHLNHLIADTEKDLERLDQSLNVSRPRKKAYAKNLERRNSCKEIYANGGYSDMQFISAVAHTMDTRLLTLEIDEEDSDEPVDHFSQESSHSQQQDHCLCVVCLAPRERTICFSPCNHAQVCVSCNSVLESLGSPCPTCRGQIQERFEIFLQ